MIEDSPSAKVVTNPTSTTATPSESEQNEILAGQLPTLVLVPVNLDDRLDVEIVAAFAEAVVVRGILFPVADAILAAVRLGVRLDVHSVQVVVILPVKPEIGVTAGRVLEVLAIEEFFDEKFRSPVNDPFVETAAEWKEVPNLADSFEVLEMECTS